MKRLGISVAIAVLASSWAGAQFVQQGGKLVGTAAVGNAFQGNSVAISADRTTAIVGGPHDNGLTGAAWVYTRSGGLWTQQAEKLVGTGGKAWPYGISQGFSVAISADGNTVILGGPDDDIGIGAAWVFTHSGGVWTQQGSKLGGTGAVAVSGGGRVNQGNAVALSADGNTAIVGGPLDNGEKGAAWVFTRSGGVWTQQGEKLVGTGAAGYGGARQGTSVALSADGNTAIVGGPGDNDATGAVWVFTRSGGVWTQQGSKLVGTGALFYSRQGSSVALAADGNTAVVGGSSDNEDAGAAWVFTRSGGVWTQQGSKLVGTVAVGSAHQGASVALSADGNTAIVGGPSDNNSIGATWVFTRSGGVWMQLGSKLVGTGAVGSAHQGGSVALSADGTTAIVGGSLDNGLTGAAWVFARSGSLSSVFWVPVVAHNPGKNDSQWRSDLGLLNTGSATADVQLTFHGTGGVVTNTTYVPPGAQSILVDVVGQLGASGQGALDVVSDQPLQVTSRTYNQVAPGQSCYPNGTQGQDYPTLTTSDGLSAGQSSSLAGLSENASYRANIGLVNTGLGVAEVTVELHDGAGSLLTSYSVSLASGEWKQETQPFRNRAGQTAMDRGYAKVTVSSGSGVVAFASVVDNITNDPTTVTMARAQFVQQGTKLVGTGAVAFTYQGRSVALSADGDTAIFGGYGDNNYGGAAWVFTRSGDVWTQQGEKLVGTGAEGPYGPNQGYSVALSADAATAIVGGPGDNISTGAVWVFTRSGGVWTQQGSKLVGTGAVGYAQQGNSVAVSADGNTAIVGGPDDNSQIGAAWVFTRSGGVWTQQGGKLVGTGAVERSRQGFYVALSGDGATAIVGGPGDDGGTGAVWVFTRSGGAWTQQGNKLVCTGAGGAAGHLLSVALSADGTTAIVGADSGNGNTGAWVFTRSGGVWTQQEAQLVGTGALGTAVQGISVALSANGTTAILGGLRDNSDTGAAWVFTRSGSVWTQLGSKLVGAGAVGSPRQGTSVALSADGTTAIVGGPQDNGGIGAAWVFTASGGEGNVLWVPVVAHNPGKNDSQWRSDLGLLNTGSATADVRLTFHGTGGVVTNTTYVPPGAQSILVDVVGQLGVSDQGSLEVVSDQPLQVTSRTYNRVAPGQSCYPNGTQGQDYPTLTTSDGLSAGQSASLAGLSENASYRANIGLVNTGPVAAAVTVELYDGAGSLLTSYSVSLASGEWEQETQPFRNRAGQTAMDRGYAKVTVSSGSGVVAFASVVDNITNDPTTITMQR